MLGRILSLLFIAACLFISTASAQDTFQERLEKFFESRTILGKLEIGRDGSRLCERCRLEIDGLAHRVKDAVGNKKYIRIEGFAPGKGNVSGSMEAARLVHDYLRGHHKIETALYLTGYAESSGEKIDTPMVEIVSYDAILPVEEGEIQTVIIR